MGLFDVLAGNDPVGIITRFAKGAKQIGDDRIKIGREQGIPEYAGRLAGEMFIDPWAHGADLMSKALEGEPINPMDVTSFVADVGMGGAIVGNQPAGALTTFGGMRSKTFPHDMISRAGELVRKGYDDEAIRKLTGLFKAQDSMVRYEIDDSAMDLIPGALEKLYRGEIDKLGDLIYHPDLFDAYPQMRDFPVDVLSAIQSMFAAGSYNHANDLISVSQIYKGSTGDALKDTLLHELQHAVQKIEGFSTGANQQSFDVLNRPINRAMLVDHLNEIINHPGSTRRRKQAANEAIGAMRDWASGIGDEYYELEKKKVANREAETRVREEIDKVRARVDKAHKKMQATKGNDPAWHEHFESFKELSAIYRDLVDKSSKLSNERLALTKRLNEITSNMRPLGKEIYKVVLGELESNSVEARRLLSAWERRQQRPDYLDFGNALIR